MPEANYSQTITKAPIDLRQESLGEPLWKGTLNAKKLDIKAIHSSGNGGQNVNKVASKAQIKFDILNYDELSFAERTLVLEYTKEKFPSMVVQDSVILTTCQEYRTLEANKTRAIKKLEKLVSDALRPKKIRIETKAPASANEHRLSDKKHIKDKKQSRTERPVFTD